MSHIKAMTQQAAESARYGDKANEAYCIAQCNDPLLRQLARQEQDTRDLSARLAAFCTFAPWYAPRGYGRDEHDHYPLA